MQRTMAHQCLGEEVDGERVGIGEELGEWPALTEGQRAYVVARPACRDSVELVQRGRAEDVEDECQLVVVVSARKERFPGEHLCKDASHGPHVDGLGGWGC
jgi:hypothetical protein